MFDFLLFYFRRFWRSHQKSESVLDYHMHKLEKTHEMNQLEIAKTLATNKSIKRQINDLDNEIQNVSELANDAVRNGNLEEAKKYLIKNEELKSQKFELEQLNSNNSNTINELIYINDNFKEDIKKAKLRRDSVEIGTSVANIKNNLADNRSAYKGSLSEFNEKLNEIEKQNDISNAKYSIFEALNQSGIDELTRQYDNKQYIQNADANLQALTYKIHGQSTIMENTEPNESIHIST